MLAMPRLCYVHQPSSQLFTPIPSAVLFIHLLAGRYSLTTSSAAMGLAAGRAGHVARNTWPWVVPRDE